ncbi:MAG: CoA transferase [bacterium]|nr:CoA transferase [bacterium]
MSLGALDGLRVLDLTHYVAGPFCTMLLADAGADVVKLEPPAGDAIRVFPSTFDGDSRLFLGLQRNKRSIAVDLKKDEGKEIALALAARADVLVEGFRPGVAEKLGLGAPSLRSANPRLVYVSVSAYGQRGPLKGRRGIDPIVQTFSGIPHEQGAGGGPQLVQGHFVDYFTGALAASAALLALFARERTGKGQYVDASLLGGAAALQTGRLVWAKDREPLENVADLLSDRSARIYETKQGHIYLYMDVDGFWERACGVLGLEEMRVDPRWAAFRDRHADRAEIISRVQEVLRTASADEWVERFEAAGVPCAKVRPPSALLEDEQMDAMGFFDEVAHPLYGMLRLVGASFHLDDTPSEIRRPAPRLGEHTDDVLAELGFSPAQIKKFGEENIVFG